MLKSPSRAPHALAPATRSSVGPKYVSAWAVEVLRQGSHAAPSAKKAPAPSIVMATESRHDALNGETLGDKPLFPMPWPVANPQPTMATMAIPVAMSVRRQTGDTTGSLRSALTD